MKRLTSQVYFAIVIIGCLVLVTNTGLSYFLKSNIPSHVWNRESGGLNDLQNVMQKISSLEASCPSEIILGSSVSKEINFGKSMNLSYLGPAMKIQSRVVEILENALTHCAASTTTIFLEILPPLYTRQATTNFSDKNELKYAFLLNWDELLKESPGEMINLATLKMRNYIAPEMTLNFIRSKLFNPDTTKTDDSIFQVFDNMYDLKNADFDPEEIKILRTIISNLSKNTKLVLYVPPQNRESWKYTDEATQRIESLMLELEHESKTTVIRADRENFAKAHFRDPLHLTTEGTQHFLNFLKIKVQI